jgi:hypothetical protein
LDWSGAEREFHQAIELNPSSPNAHYGHGVLLVVTGRLEGAVSEEWRGVFKSTDGEGLSAIAYEAGGEP